MLKPAYTDRFETGVTWEGLASLTAVAHRFDELVNRAPNRQAPYVGASAFTTKAGIHASAIAKDPRTYEHVAPEAVGNRRHVLVSDQAGKANLLVELNRTQVGDRYVLESMRANGFNVGGEQSGHIILSDYTTTCDGLVASLQFLSVVKEAGLRVS